MKIMVDLKKVLAEEIEGVDKWIKQSATERDEASTPTESTHDQTRQIANQLFNSLLDERLRLQKLSNIVAKYKEILVMETSAGKKQKFMIVPDGLGGKKVDEVVLVGEGSNLGQKIASLKVGESTDLNGNTYFVIDIET